MATPALWIDSDDENSSSSSPPPKLKRRKRFETIHGSSKSKSSWIHSDVKSNDANATAVLSASSLSVKRLPSPPRVRGHNKHSSTTLNFHPSRPNLYVVGDMSGGIRLCQGSSVLSEVSIKELPVRNLAFEPKGKTILITGRRPFYYVYDLESQKYLKYASPFLDRRNSSLETFANSESLVAFGGNDGVISLCCSRTRRFVQKLRLNGTVRDMSFKSNNQNEMLAIGSEGEIYRYDLRTWKCMERWRDEGNLNGTLIRCLNHGCVSGSSSGVLNVYSSLDAVVGEKRKKGWGVKRIERKPKYSVMNLTTEINDFCLGRQGVAAMSSRKERDSLKLFDIRNGTVFKEWPVEKTPLGHVTSLDFDVTGEVLGICNRQGRVLLYNVNKS